MKWTKVTVSDTNNERLKAMGASEGCSINDLISRLMEAYPRVGNMGQRMAELERQLEAQGEAMTKMGRTIKRQQLQLMRGGQARSAANGAYVDAEGNFSPESW